MAKRMKEDDGRLNLKLDMSDPQQKIVKEFLNLLVRKKSEYISALVFAHLKELGIVDVSVLTKSQAKEIMHDAIMKSISQNGITRFVSNDPVNFPAYSFPVRGGLNNGLLNTSGNIQQEDHELTETVSKSKPNKYENKEQKHDTQEQTQKKNEDIHEIVIQDTDEQSISDELSSVLDSW